MYNGREAVGTVLCFPLIRMAVRERNRDFAIRSTDLSHSAMLQRLQLAQSVPVAITNVSSQRRQIDECLLSSTVTATIFKDVD
jgi:hypothetical protein